VTLFWVIINQKGVKEMKRWKPEEKARIVKEALEAENIQDVCRRYQLAPGQLYRWRDAFLAEGDAGLVDHRKRNHRKTSLEIENQKLTYALGRQALIIEEQKKVLEKYQRESN
jgi:transposase-like protein